LPADCAAANALAGEIVMGFIWNFLCTYIGAFFDRTNNWMVGMDFTQWIYVLVVAVVFGFVLLRGNADKLGS